MTKNFRRFLVVTLIMLLSGLYTGERIFFMGLSVLIAIILYSLLTTIWVYMDFNYIQAVEPKMVTKGQRATLVMEIHNDKPFIFPFIKIQYYTPYSAIMGYVEEASCSVLPFKQYTIKKDIDCPIRGRFDLGIATVEVGDLFGLFRFSMDLTKKAYHRPLRLRVLPRILNLTNLPLSQSPQAGHNNRSMAGTEEFSNISDLRQYRYGDPLKKIHWKASSKLQEIQVKNYETNTEPNIFLFLEPSPHENKTIEDYEIEDRIVESGIAVASYLLEKELSLRLIAYGENRRILDAKGPPDFERLYDFLSYLPLHSPFTMADILDMEYRNFERDSALIVVLRRLDPKLFNLLYMLKDGGVSILIIYIGSHNREGGYNVMIKELRDKGIDTIAIDPTEPLSKALEAI